jgi:hypothetical protein
MATLTSTSATLNAYVNPEGSEVTECHFEYGRFPSLEASVPCSALPGAGSSPVKVSAVATGLTNGANYVVRLVATNAIGTTVGRTGEGEQDYPEVVRLRPSRGRTGGGKRVKVLGFGIQGLVAAVHFGAISARFEHARCNFRTNPRCPLIAISPPEAAGTVDVTVTTRGVTTAVTPNDRFTYK